MSFRFGSFASQTEHSYRLSRTLKRRHCFPYGIPLHCEHSSCGNSRDMSRTWHDPHTHPSSLQQSSYPNTLQITNPQIPQSPRRFHPFPQQTVPLQQLLHHSIRFFHSLSQDDHSIALEDIDIESPMEDSEKVQSNLPSVTETTENKESFDWEEIDIPDPFAKSRIINYLKRQWIERTNGTESQNLIPTRLHNVTRVSPDGRNLPSFIRSQLPTMEPSHWFRCELTVLLPFGEDQLAMGLAPTPKDAELLASMHAIRLLDWYGIPLYSVASRQERHMTKVRREGRYVSTLQNTSGSCSEQRVLEGMPRPLWLDIQQRIHTDRLGEPSKDSYVRLQTLRTVQQGQCTQKSSTSKAITIGGAKIEKVSNDINTFSKNSSFIQSHHNISTISSALPIPLSISLAADQLLSTPYYTLLSDYYHHGIHQQQRGVALFDPSENHTWQCCSLSVTNTNQRSTEQQHRQSVSPQPLHCNPSTLSCPSMDSLLQNLNDSSLLRFNPPFLKCISVPNVLNLSSLQRIRNWLNRKSSSTMEQRITLTQEADANGLVLIQAEIDLTCPTVQNALEQYRMDATTVLCKGRDGNHKGIEGVVLTSTGNGMDATRNEIREKLKYTDNSKPTNSLDSPLHSLPSFTQLIPSTLLLYNSSSSTTDAFPCGCRAKGKAQHVSYAVVLASMHAEMILDHLGIELFENPLEQYEHAQQVRSMTGRYAPFPQPCLTGLKDNTMKRWNKDSLADDRNSENKIVEEIVENVSEKQQSSIPQQEPEKIQQQLLTHVVVPKTSLKIPIDDITAVTMESKATRNTVQTTVAKSVESKVKATTATATKIPSMFSTPSDRIENTKIVESVESSNLNTTVTLSPIPSNLLPHHRPMEMFHRHSFPKPLKQQPKSHLCDLQILTPLASKGLKKPTIAKAVEHLSDFQRQHPADRFRILHNELIVQEAAGALLECCPPASCLEQCRRELSKRCSSEHSEGEAVQQHYPELFVFTRMGDLIRATLILQVDSSSVSLSRRIVAGLRGANAIGKTAEQAMGLAALHALELQ